MSSQERPDVTQTMLPRPLHFIWIADCSSSMGRDGKIQALNTAIRKAIPYMRKVAKKETHFQILMRAVRFSNGAEWHIAQPTPVELFEWIDLQAQGDTDMGKAFELVAEQLKIPPMEQRAITPVLVLVSDGQPTDDFASGLKYLLGLPWGQRALRIAIAVGEDADHSMLQEFISNPELKPLEAATSPETLIKFFSWGCRFDRSDSFSMNQFKDPSKVNLPTPLPTYTNYGDDIW